jgi:probable HAF family extracellular repeat protein
MNPIKLLSAIIVAGTFAACSPSPLPDPSPVTPPETTAPGTPDSSTPGTTDPQPPVVVDPNPPVVQPPVVTMPPQPTAPNPPVVQPPVVQPPVNCIQTCRYTVTDVAEANSLTLSKLNGAGEIYGIRNVKPVIYSNGVFTDLPTPPDINESQTRADETDRYQVTVNQNGDYLIAKRIINTAFTNVRYHTWFHRKGSPENAFIYKGNTHGIAMSEAGHNLSDDVKRAIGNTPSLGINSVIPTMIWNVNTNVDTPISGPRYLKAINDSGVAVGQDVGPSNAQPVKWQNGVTTRLGSLDPSGASEGIANDINNDGVIVGHSRASGKVRAFRYFNGAAGLRMALMGDAGCQSTDAIAINTAGDSVLNGTGCPNSTTSGNAALLNRPGFTQNLNDFISRDDGWELTTVIDINDRGQILGLGKRNGVNKYFRLNPI